MRFSIHTHKVIALAGFLILASVLFYLTYSTYMLKDKQYQVAEKALMNEHYSRSIRNDKLFPGGARIIDTYITRHKFRLEDAYYRDPVRFSAYAQGVCDSIFRELRRFSNTDSLFEAMLEAHSLDPALEYLLIISSIKLTFKHPETVSLYHTAEQAGSLPDSLMSSAGVIIGGRLKKPLPQNLVTNLTVSSPVDYSYQITFALYAGKNNRTRAIIRLMMPTFMLSVFSLLCVIFIYFVTYRNWIRQKKLAEMKSDFVNSITHEFHIPISTIMVANKSLQNEKIASKKENLRNLTDVIQRQSERLQYLFGQVLDITKINRSTLEKKEYDLNELLEEVMLDYRLRITREKLMLDFVKGNGVGMVKLNRFWFTTMLFNMFDNAVKYNNKPEKKITVRTSAGANGIAISIEDNGIGMKKKTVKHILEKFYRGNKHDMNPVPGLGLGLFYAKQCIDAHRWRLSVSSEEGTGSKFIIHIV